MKLNEEIENLITEEQGIANEMYNIAANICLDLYNTIKSTPKTNWDRIEFVSFKKGIKKYRLWNGNGIEIRWFYYNFYDKVTFDKEIHRIRQINATSENLDVITITVLAISGNIINDTLFDTIHHELEHVYKFDYDDELYTALMESETGMDDDDIVYNHSLYNKLQLLKKGETAIDKIQRKMARTIFKARTDYMSKNFTEIKDSYFTQK